MRQLILTFFTLLFCNLVWAANTTNKIDGLWEVRYDASNTPSAHIRITTQANGEVMGVIENAYPRPGDKNASPNCTKCEGANKDKPIVGLKVLWGMKPAGTNEWDSGHLLDAETGKVYSGKMKMTHDNNQLDLRGYVGIPIFGDTSTWKRIGK